MTSDPTAVDTCNLLLVGSGHAHVAVLADWIRRGVPPGGNIMIHGLPNVLKRPLSYYRDIDWTNGCIAVNNDHMLEIWLLTRNQVPVEIRP